MSYFQTPPKHKASYTIFSLKQAVLADNPCLSPLVRLFQGLLESVGTPETEECTLNHLKEFKAQALMYYIRAYQNNNYTLEETIQQIQTTCDEILFKYYTEEGSSITKILSKNDDYLSHRFKNFLDLLNTHGTDKAGAIVSLHEEFPLHSFQFEFCKFLDQMHTSLQHYSELEVQSQIPQSM